MSSGKWHSEHICTCSPVNTGLVGWLFTQSIAKLYRTIWRDSHVHKPDRNLSPYGTKNGFWMSRSCTYVTLLIIEPCVRENSFPPSHFCMRTAEFEFMFTTMFHPNSSWEIVFVRIAPFRLFSNFVTGVVMEIALCRSKIATLILARTRNCLTWSMPTTLFCWLKTKVSCKFSSIVWTILWISF